MNKSSIIKSRQVINRSDYGTFMQPKDAVLEEIYLNQAMNNRTIMFVDEFDRETCYKAIYFLERIERQDDIDEIPMNERTPITIKINSYGGDVFHCYALISVIERLKDRGYAINTHTMGVAFSCGFLLAITGTHRTIARRGYLMCHQISSGVIGEIQRMEEEVDFTKEMWEASVDIIKKYTNITGKQLDHIKRSKVDWYMSAEESLKLGVTDEIV